jgi:NADPH2:quinone reductase
VADEKFVVPRALSLGNFKLCGVMLSYADDMTGPMLKRHMGWNFASTSLGAEITRNLVDLLVAGKIRPVIGRVCDFSEVPDAFEAMAAGKTVGRTVVRM